MAFPEQAKIERTEEQPSRLSILLANYRESRSEGTRLAHSVFSDVTFAAALLASIIGGGVIADKPTLLLLIPFVIGGLSLYAVQKLRVNNLITSYLIYLESAVNRELGEPVLIWNSEFIRRNVSAGRQSQWGQALMIFLAVLVSGIYAAICLWPYLQNPLLFGATPILKYAYAGGCLVFYVFMIVGLVSTMRVTNLYTPDYIEKLLQERKIQYSAPPTRNQYRNGKQ